MSYAPCGWVSQFTEVSDGSARPFLERSLRLLLAAAAVAKPKQEKKISKSLPTDAREIYTVCQCNLEDV